MSRFLRWVRFLARALLALAMVAGYYALSLVVAAGSVVLIVVVVRWHGPSIALVMLGALAVLSLWTAGRVLFERGKQDGDLPGIVLDAAAEPALFSLVADVAREVGTRPPDEIRLIPDANAFVTEVGGTFGFGRRRVLALGYLDLRASNRSELVATIAHELGHFVAGDTALGPLVCRAHTVLVRSIVLLEQGGTDHFYGVEAARAVLTAGLTAYAKLSLRVSLGVARQQELEADRVAIRLAGRTPHVRMLARTGVDIVTLNAFLDREIAPLARAGFWPNAFWEGYDAFARATHEEIAHKVRGRQADPYDTHPSPEERVRFAEGVVGDDPVEDTRSALELLADPHAPWARLEEALGPSLERCAWADVPHIRGKRVFETASETHRAYAALSIGGGWGEAAKGAMRCLFAEGPYRLVGVAEPELLQVNGPTWHALAPVVLGVSLGSVVAMALVEERGGRFVHEVGRGLAVDLGGARVRPFELAEAASASREAFDELWRWLDGPLPEAPSAPTT